MQRSFPNISGYFVFETDFNVPTHSCNDKLMGALNELWGEPL